VNGYRLYCSSSSLRRILLAAAVLLLTPASAWAAGASQDPVAPTLLALIFILGAAKVGSEVFERMNQPAVLGELLAGVVLGNLILMDPSWGFMEALRSTGDQPQWAVVIDQLSRLGVIILLFQVGLESTVSGMRKVGASSFLVATLGVAAPFVLGYAVSRFMIREPPPALLAVVPPGFSLNYIHLFVGAVLCATSVGITARVLKDLGKTQRKESQIILGAAVIDDVLGLLILAVVAEIVAAAELGQPMQAAGILRLAAAVFAFLVGALALGAFLVPRIMRHLARLRTSGIMLISSLLLAFGLAYAASKAGLAPIVGAFAAGLILEDVHFRAFRQEITIEQLLHPIATFLVPIFFVLMGIHVRLETFADPAVLGLAAGLTLAAIAGKQICGLGVLEKHLDRLSVGVGMIPRGEVGLILAGIGKTLKVIDDGTFSAIVIMVMLTTLCTPPVLKYTLLRWDKRSPSVPSPRRPE
jgi:Kef-type K+ transport system membrane component KefB